jgi:hypothetical protein
VAELACIEAPVHAGADRPLMAPRRHAERIHGVSGLGGPEPMTPRRDSTTFDMGTRRETAGLCRSTDLFGPSLPIGRPQLALEDLTRPRFR